MYMYFMVYSQDDALINQSKLRIFYCLPENNHLNTVKVQGTVHAMSKGCRADLSGTTN